MYCLSGKSPEIKNTFNSSAPNSFGATASAQPRPPGTGKTPCSQTNSLNGANDLYKILFHVVVAILAIVLAGYPILIYKYLHKDTPIVEQVDMTCFKEETKDDSDYCHLQKTENADVYNVLHR